MTGTGFSDFMADSISGEITPAFKAVHKKTAIETMKHIRRDLINGICVPYSTIRPGALKSPMTTSTLLPFLTAFFALLNRMK